MTFERKMAYCITPLDKGVTEVEARRIRRQEKIVGALELVGVEVLLILKHLFLTVFGWLTLLFCEVKWGGTRFLSMGWLLQALLPS